VDHRAAQGPVARHPHGGASRAGGAPELWRWHVAVACWPAAPAPLLHSGLPVPPGSSAPAARSGRQGWHARLQALGRFGGSVASSLPGPGRSHEARCAATAALALPALTQPWPAPLSRCRPQPPQVDPVFEGLAGGPGSLVKYNPLSNLSSAETWNFLRVMGVPINALHACGYDSIGCEPCTRPVLPNQHEREGRWWWEDAQGEALPPAAAAGARGGRLRCAAWRARAGGVVPSRLVAPAPAWRGAARCMAERMPSPAGATPPAHLPCPHPPRPAAQPRSAACTAATSRAAPTATAARSARRSATCGLRAARWRRSARSRCARRGGWPYLRTDAGTHAARTALLRNSAVVGPGASAVQASAAGRAPLPCPLPPPCACAR
jgi:hypothetical protein